MQGIFGTRGSVVAAAHTGVEASNVGCGGRTLASLFKITGDTYMGELKGPMGKELGMELRECRILIINEISMAGSQQLAAVSERLRECADAESSSGGVGVVFSGGFAQLPLIGQRPLIYNARPGKREGGGESSAVADLGAAGRRRFGEVAACARPMVVYRQGDPCPFKESIMRLRDGR